MSLKARGAGLDVVLNAGASGDLVVELLQLGVRPQHVQPVDANGGVDSLKAGNVGKGQVLSFWDGVGQRTDEP